MNRQPVFKTFDELIDLWPSGAEFARDIDVKPSHVGVFKVRKNIPSEHWPAIIKAAEGRGIAGVTAETLLAVQASMAAQSA
jgi:hypothetical protein